jgi:hypothetical protein
MAILASAVVMIDDFLMGSESDDSDDDDADMLAAVLSTSKIRRSVVPKVVGFVENIVPNYSDGDFRADFRFLFILLYNNNLIGNCACIVNIFFNAFTELFAYDISTFK